jgi:hypothetical protein
VAEVIYGFFTSKGYKMSLDTFQTALGRVDVDPGFPGDLGPYMDHHAKILLDEKKIKAVPDWKKGVGGAPRAPRPPTHARITHVGSRQGLDPTYALALRKAAPPHPLRPPPARIPSSEWRTP